MEDLQGKILLLEHGLNSLKESTTKRLETHDIKIEGLENLIQRVTDLESKIDSGNEKNISENEQVSI